MSPASLSETLLKSAGESPEALSGIFAPGATTGSSFPSGPRKKTPDVPRGMVLKAFSRTAASSPGGARGVSAGLAGGGEAAAGLVGGGEAAT